MHLKIGSTVSRRPPIAPRLAPIYQAVKCLRRRRGQQQRRINEKSRRLPTFRPRPPSFTYSTSSHSSQPPRAAPVCLLWVFRVDATTCVLSPRSDQSSETLRTNGGGNFGRNRVRYLSSPVPLSLGWVPSPVSVVLGVKPAGR